MGGIVSEITDSIGITNYGAQKSKAEVTERLATDKANEQEAQLIQQKRVIEAQKEAEQTSLNAKKKRMASAQSGASGLLNFNPQGQSSILG